MRMRRKKYLEERINDNGGYLIIIDRYDQNSLTAIQTKNYIDYKKVFGNDNPIELDIGCGKGGFVVQSAKRNPNTNYIAIEKISNVLVEAIEQAKTEQLTNVKFINSCTEYLPKYILPKTISTIHLNFSTPLPKKGYEKQRLTSPRFLSIYKEMLTDNGQIIQKTDNLPFFEYSIKCFCDCGYKIVYSTYDLASEQDIHNIVTEHEQRFLAQGIKINKLIAKL